MERLLVFQHVANEPPGLLKNAADECGVTLDIIELWKPYNIPKVLNYDGLIIMGGPMGVYENYPSEQDELTTIKQALGRIPIIGFCLGSQLLAHALGANVYPNMISGKRVKEIGYYDVELTDQGLKDSMLRGFSSKVKVLQWHGDAFDLPKDATLLATSPLCHNQAFVYGKNAYGFLFHFEFTPEMVDKQIEIDRTWIHQDHDIDEEKLKQEAREYGSLMEEQYKRLFNNFISVGAAH